jgi:hypothetical protein
MYHLSQVGMASVGAKNALAGAHDHVCKPACVESVCWLSLRLAMPHALTFWGLPGCLYVGANRLLTLLWGGVGI